MPIVDLRYGLAVALQSAQITRKFITRTGHRLLDAYNPLAENDVGEIHVLTLQEIKRVPNKLLALYGTFLVSAGNMF